MFVLVVRYENAMRERDGVFRGMALAALLADPPPPRAAPIPDRNGTRAVAKHRFRREL